ncbi:MAG TPA: XdhC/CoxI family protein [Burkholderiales bacterium]|nr:XdhC/CoxI family protein [Burkholderiales bacterium]
MKELELIGREVERLRAEGRSAVLATVVDIRGSSYRLPGARMLISGSQWIAGSVSGGCLEGDVVLRAREVLEHDRATVVTYDTTSDEDILFGVGLGCRGVIDVLIEPLQPRPANPDLVAFIRRCLEKRERGLVATVVRASGHTAAKTGERVVRFANGETASNVTDGGLRTDIDNRLARIGSEASSHMARIEREGAQADVFIEVIEPPLPLVIFGAGHDALPMARLAKELGWHVSVVDHRPAYATRSRFPLADAVLVASPEEAVRGLQLDARTVALIMTHNYLRDLEVLKILLPSPIRYIGLLGPRRRAGELLAELEKQSLSPTPEQAQRLYAPVGLDLGAEGPEGVALSVLAEIQAVVASRAPGHLRERKGSIHGLTTASPTATPAATRV